MKAPHPVFLAATRLDGLGQALLAGQPVAVSGLALSETAAVMYAAATEIRELRAQVAALAQADAGAQVQAERDSLLSGLREAVQVWTQKRESSRRDGDRRAEIIYSAVVSRALDVLSDQATEEPAQAEAGAGQEAGTRDRTYTWAEVHRAQWAIHMAHWHGRRGGASEEVLSALFWAQQCVVNVLDGKDPTDALPEVVARVDAALAQADAGGEAQ